MKVIQLFRMQVLLIAVFALERTFSLCETGSDISMLFPYSGKQNNALGNTKQLT